MSLGNRSKHVIAREHRRLRVACVPSLLRASFMLPASLPAAASDDVLAMLRLPSDLLGGMAAVLRNVSATGFLSADRNRT
jgi:hypothetical protein